MKLELIPISGLVISLFTFAFSLYRQFKLDKKHYALGMIREWNQQTANDKMIIEKAIPGIYEKCYERCLDNELLEKIYNAANADNEKIESSKTENSTIDYLAAKQAIIRLLNYFEFISSAYLNGAVDRKIIQKSFTGTMFRYYCVLYSYLKMEIEKTGRNPWEPYLEFIGKLTKQKNKHVPLADCFVNESNSFLKCSKNSDIILDGGLMKVKNISKIRDEKIRYFLANFFQKIIDRFQPIEIWFWGSRIYGDARPDSDIDVLIVSDVFSDIRLIKRRSTFLKTIGKLYDKNLPVVDAFCLTPKEFMNKKKENGFFKDLVEKGIRVL